MTEYVCEYCGKIYKTEKGFQKHICKNKIRFELLKSNNNLFWNLLWFHKLMYISIPKYGETGEVRKKLCLCKYFDEIHHLTSLEDSIDFVPREDYLKYLICNRINIKEWCEYKHIKNFLYEWLYQEPESNAIQRSMKYLMDKNLDITKLSSLRLTNMLMNGNISVKFLNKIGYNYLNNIEGDSSEIKSLQYFLRG